MAHDASLMKLHVPFQVEWASFHVDPAAKAVPGLRSKLTDDNKSLAKWQYNG